MAIHTTAEVFKLIGERIRERRKYLKLTQVKVCELLACDRRYFQKIESGKASITVSTLNKIATVLDVPLSALVQPTEYTQKSKTTGELTQTPNQPSSNSQPITTPTSVSETDTSNEDY